MNHKGGIYMTDNSGKAITGTYSSGRVTTLRLVVTAMFMGLTIVFSMANLSIPVPGGHLYLCDMFIALGAILLNPIEAFVVGGLGSFFGDMFFYPTPMFVSLATHGLQAVVISLIAHHALKHHPKLASGIAVTVGAVIMVIGYTLGKGLIYSTWEAAYLKLPYEIAQGALGAVLGMVLCWGLGVRKMFNRLINNA